MSASSKKQLNRERKAAKMTERQLAEQKEAKQVKLYTTAFVVVMAAILVIAICVGVNQTITNSGVRENNTVAMTVGEHKVSNTQLNYFYIDAVNNFYSNYGSYASMFGLDVTKPLDEQYVDADQTTTWADDFLATAKDTAVSVYAMADAAAAEGYQLSEDEVAALEQSLSSMDLYAAMYGYEDADAYLKAMYGYGASKEGYLEYAKLSALADSYYSHHAASLTYEDSDLRAAEAEDFNAYSSYTYNSYYLSTTKFLTGGTTDENGNTTYTDEEKAASVAAAKAAADSIAAAEIATAADLDAAIAALEINKDTSAASTRSEDVLATNLSTTYGEWLKDSARKSGDITVVENAYTDTDGNETVNGYYVIRFDSSNENTFALKNARHILVSFQGGTTDETTGATVYSDEEKAAAKASAEEILAQWKENPTEDNFAALANEKSDDGDGTTGGLYEDIYPGQMVTNFNDWCYDASRASGDTGIVETEYGYHVMYFVGDADHTYRDYLIESDLRDADMQAWYEGVIAAPALTDGEIKYISTDLVLSAG